MSETDKIVIRTEGLTKSYKGVQALKSLDLTVKKNKPSIGQ